jgi:NAD(P)-dependent dehydrogenase (short-subunit alcohol dehydrogenase family)
MNVVLITGASSGIGESTAKLFVERGWRVCATARHPENLGAWSRGHQVNRVPLDVTDPVSVHTAVQECLHAAGRIDVLVNNAGIGMAGPLEAMSVGDIERHFQTNFFGAIRMIQAVVPHFRVQNKGTIVNVSSVAGRFGVPFLSPYCAGKFALEGLSESLYYELAPFNIRIKLIEPGGIKTNFAQKFAHHDSYQPNLGAIEQSMMKASGPESPLPGPAGVAEAIFRSCTDGTERLRYPVHTQGVDVVHKLLPERLWRSMMAKSQGMELHSSTSTRS